MATLPAFHGSIGFNAHHSPMGGFFSFTCGHVGTRGGLGTQMGRPADQDIYIGIKDGDRHAATPLRCLPFYEGADKGAQAAMPEVAQQSAAAASNFLVEQAAADPDLADPDAEKKKPKIAAYPLAQIQRHYGWATDRWTTADFTFTIYTPFGEIPDPATARPAAMREALLPAVTAEICVDNSQGTHTKTAFFALGFHAPGVRILDSGLPKGRAGFSFKDETGVVAEVVEISADGKRHAHDETGLAPFVFMRWSPNDGLAERDNPVHLLGSCPGVGVEVPAGKKYVLKLALGCFLPNVVTTRLEGKYLYTRYYASLSDVLNEALAYMPSIREDVAAIDAKLLDSGLNADQQFLIAHATRSYYGSTQLLEVGGLPYWIVNEGEYCMLNTLDLSVDHVFWELKYNPWVVKNVLDNFVRYYAYHDQVKDPKTGELFPGGISFAHDQGVHNQFSPLGRSSYELTNLDGCFSYMTMEQLCNWSLIAASYVVKTDDAEWLRQNAGVIKACLDSMNRRCPDGVVALDSSYCGGGQEITTYDSLDASLGQARNNLYLAVKGLATFEGLCYLLTALKESELAERWHNAAQQAAAAIAGQMLPKEGFIPAVFEPENAGYKSKILPAIEGLVYPLYWAGCDAKGCAYLSGEFLNEKDAGAMGKLLVALRKHTAGLLAEKADGQNRFADGGVKLSSTSNNSWVSKIALFEHVAREIFNLDERGGERKEKAGAGGWEKSDAAHTKWQTEGASAYWACSDQMVNGVAKGSKYYPRIVTTVLWMKD